MATISAIRWALTCKHTGRLVKVGSSGRPATFATFDGLLKWYSKDRHNVQELYSKHIVLCEDGVWREPTA